MVGIVVQGIDGVEENLFVNVFYVFIFIEYIDLE